MPYTPTENAGKVYFMKSQSGRSYMTIRVGFNPLTRKMEAQIANEVEGIPPAGMPEMDMKTYSMIKNGKLRGRH